MTDHEFVLVIYYLFIDGAKEFHIYMCAYCSLICSTIIQFLIEFFRQCKVSFDRLLSFLCKMFYSRSNEIIDPLSAFMLRYSSNGYFCDWLVLLLRFSNFRQILFFSCGPFERIMWLVFTRIVKQIEFSCKFFLRILFSYCQYTFYIYIRYFSFPACITFHFHRVLTTFPVLVNRILVDM